MKMNVTEAMDLFRVYCFSLTARERKELFERAEESVEIFKPKLEERLGITFGEIRPKSYLSRPFLEIRQQYTEAVKKSIAESNPGIFGRGIILVAHAPVWDLIRLPLFHFVTQDYVLGAGGSNGVFYISEGLYIRKGLFVERHFGENFPLDEIVVHELGHEAWRKLGGEKLYKKLPLNEQKKFLSRKRTWNEGFCSYLQKDLVPSPTLGLLELYKEGLKKVRGVLEEKGNDYLREIPKNWLSLAGIL